MSTPDLASLLQRFFTEHLVQERNLSPCTIAAYRDTFRLFLQFLQRTRRTTPSRMPLAILTPSNVLAFLSYLEKERHNSARSRNARLAVLRSFIHYLSDRLGPELPVAVRRVLAIPLKRHDHRMPGFLTQEEVQTLLNSTEDTWTGRRNHLLFLLLYNTGGRISEILNLRVSDAQSAGGRYLTLHGKGRKERQVPLWKSTQQRLRQWIKENHLSAECPLLSNRFGQPLSRSGAAYQLQESARKALPSLNARRISPHTFRHTTAMHLLQSGVAPEVIALWLGHESPNTTHLYVEADMEMKRKTLDTIAAPKIRQFPSKHEDQLLHFLENL